MPRIDRTESKTARRRALSGGARGLAGLLMIVSAARCTYTVAGDTPAAIEPPRPSFQPSVEHTVAEFSFALGGGDMAPSISDGRLLSNEIMASWQERGYVRAQQYVADGSFSATADYRLTLRGSQRGETSFTMQVINALTLSLVPYTITQRYELHYVLEDVRSGTHYHATVQAWDTTWVEPFLILALPFAGRGHDTTMQRVGDELYEQFRRQGAFTASRAAVRPSAAAAVDRPRDQTSPSRAPVESPSKNAAPLTTCTFAARCRPSS